MFVFSPFEQFFPVKLDESQNDPSSRCWDQHVLQSSFIKIVKFSWSHNSSIDEKVSMVLQVQIDQNLSDIIIDFELKLDRFDWL